MRKRILALILLWSACAGPIIAENTWLQDLAEVPVDPSNLYKLLRGDTKNPTRAVRAGIERVVKEHEQDKPQ